MEDVLSGCGVLIRQTSLDIFKAGMNVFQADSRGSSIPRTPMGREETLEDVLDL